MNQATSLFGSRKYLVALGAVAVLAAALFGLSTLFAHASTGPTITTTITNSSNAVVTSAPIGSTVTAGAMVASTTSSTPPTGTVNFSTYADQNCTGSPTVQSGVSLVNSMASSSAATMGAGGLSFLVNYNGDASNTPDVSACAPVSPTSASVSITPSLSSNSVNAGSSITAGAALNGVTSAATGTLAYNFYTDNACTLATSSPASVTVANASVPESAAMTFNQPGTYYLQEVYSGDNANAGATTTCGSEVLTVNSVAPTVNPTTLSLALSSTSVMAGASVNASSTLGGETATAGGTVAYNVYSDNACTLGLSGAGTATVADGIVPNSNSIIFNTPGNYFWQAVYSGDTHNAMATTSCNELMVAATSTTIGTTTPPAGAGTISGTVYNDVNRDLKLDAGDAGIPGITIKLSVLQSNWWLNLIGLSKYTEVTTTVTDANGNYSFGNLPAGVYKVEEINQAGWHQDTADFKPVPLLDNNSGASGLNFANHATGSNTGGSGGSSGTGSTTGTALINGKVYNDVTNAGIPGITIKLSQNGTQVTTMVSAADGTYSFAGLAAGTYKVEEINQAGWHQDTSDKTVTVAAGGTSTVNFGNSPVVAAGNNGNGNGNGFGFGQGNNGNNNDNGNNNKGKVIPFVTPPPVVPPSRGNDNHGNHH